MIAVMFEVSLKPHGSASYFDLALSLKQELISMPGFISIERFESLTETKENTVAKILSLSFWQDEDAVQNWRNQSSHIQAQLLGRQQIFVDYRIRVAKVLRDYSMNDREDAPTEFKLRGTKSKSAQPK